MAVRKSTKYIVIHCSATRPNMDVGAKEIDSWHRANGWNGIGYHYVIRRNGKIEKGRQENLVGSHVAGHNSNSVGVCLVEGIAATGKGWPPENNFTDAQWDSLRDLLNELTARYPSATILGHRDFPRVNKACPSFDARAWARQNGFRPAPSMKSGVSQAFGGLVGGEIVGSQTRAVGESLSENSDSIAEALGTAQSHIAEAAQYLTCASYALEIIGFAIALYGLYRLGVMARRWWRGEQDYGAPEVEEGYGDMNPEAVAAYVSRIQKQKKRGR